MQVGLALTGVISGATLLYALRLGVDVLQPQRLNRGRMVPLAALVVVLVAGMVRASGSTSPWSWSSAAGAVTGFAVVAGAAALLRSRTRRAAGQPESQD